MKVGTKVAVLCDINLHPHALVRRGETGEVVENDSETGEITIKLDATHWGLSEWHNTLWMLAPYTDEISMAIGVVPVLACA